MNVSEKYVSFINGVIENAGSIVSALKWNLDKTPLGLIAYKDDKQTTFMTKGETTVLHLRTFSALF